MRGKSEGRELTPLQLEILQILWEQREAPVSKVHEELRARGRKLAYSTVMTLCRRLAKRGVLEYYQRGRAYIYSPAVERKSVLKRILKRVARQAFRGSDASLAMAILTDCQMDAAELAKLRKLIAEKEREIKGRKKKS